MFVCGVFCSLVSSNSVGFCIAFGCDYHFLNTAVDIAMSKGAKKFERVQSNDDDFARLGGFVICLGCQKTTIQRLDQHKSQMMFFSY